MHWLCRAFYICFPEPVTHLPVRAWKINGTKIQEPLFQWNFRSLTVCGHFPSHHFHQKSNHAGSEGNRHAFLLAETDVVMLSPEGTVFQKQGQHWVPRSAPFFEGDQSVTWWPIHFIGLPFWKGWYYIFIEIDSLEMDLPLMYSLLLPKLPFSFSSSSSSVDLLNILSNVMVFSTALLLI